MCEYNVWGREFLKDWGNGRRVWRWNEISRGEKKNICREVEEDASIMRWILQ